MNHFTMQINRFYRLFALVAASTLIVTQASAIEDLLRSALDCGMRSTLVVDVNGNLWGWGQNRYGEIGGTANTTRTNALQVAGLSNIVSVASGGDVDGNGVLHTHTLALAADGRVWVMGNNDYGQLGDGTTADKSSPIVNTNLSNIVSIACGAYHSLVLKADGSLLAFGGNGQGQIGDNTTTTPRKSPVSVIGLSNVVAMAAGQKFSLAVMSDGTVWAWGENALSQLGLGVSGDAHIPTKIPALSNIVSVASGVQHGLALRADGTVWGWGDYYNGQVGNGQTMHSSGNREQAAPVQLATLSNIVTIAAGGYHSLAVRNDGALFAWGDNQYGQLGYGVTVDTNRPVMNPTMTKVVAISAGEFHTIAQDAQARIWGWGYSAQGQVGSGAPMQNINSTPAVSSAVTAARYERGHTLLLKTEGTVWSFGLNAFGQLGDGSQVGRMYPAQIPYLSEIVQAEAGGGHSAAVRRDGSVYIWGANSFGQIGNADPANRLIPVALTNVGAIRSVSLGTRHTVAVKADGTALTWGANNFGQAGTGTRTNETSPAPIASLNQISAAASGGAHTLFLNSNGFVWAVGRNSHGQLGIGAFTNRITPIQISSLSNIAALAAGASHSLALNTTGGVYAWGANGYGQLGDNSVTNRATPNVITGLAGIKAIVAGDTFSAALGSNGFVYAWGDNSRAQLGDSNSMRKLTATLVSGISNVAALKAGGDHLVATLKDGTVQTWGSDAFGQLGTRGMTNRFAPATIPRFNMQWQTYESRSNSSLAQSARFWRGTGTNPTYHSFVIPIEGQRGVAFKEIEDQVSSIFSPNPWSADFYHFNATNLASSTNLGNRLSFRTPIAAFGSRVGGSPLYTYQPYAFAVSAGNPSPPLTNALQIRVFARSNLTYVGTLTVGLPQPSQTNEWADFLKNGYTRQVSGFGLFTTISFNGVPTEWGIGTNVAYSVTHQCDSVGRQNLFEVGVAGKTDQGWTVVDASYAAQPSLIYSMEFDELPPWRSTFIDQPHFDGSPLPSFYAGKTVVELRTNYAKITNQVSLAQAPSTYTNLNHSPELRRHSALDQLVADLGNDPVALANYVQNEIELTDAFSFNDAGPISETSVNLGGVSRSALAVLREGKGSAAEQCALLVYLLRQAGIPAVYMYPPRNGLQMLDSRLSRLLRAQIRNTVNDRGELTDNTVNLALGKSATQSSTGFGGEPGFALDGNRNGRYSDGSVSHTGNEANPWWEVDLGAVQALGDVQVWGRTDCCSDRLSDFYVLISDVPFSSAALSAVTNQAGVSAYYQREMMVQGAIPVNRSGRYVRIQLASTNYLSLAEVRITAAGTLIPVNYPWVAAYAGTNWVHLFPWIKDTEIDEGLNLYDSLPSDHDNGYKWVRDYLLSSTNILSLSEVNTPATLFPEFVKQQLAIHQPGVALDDIGNRVRDRRHYYSRFEDFPRPTSLTNASYAVESFAVITNTFPSMTNLFDTVSLEITSLSNTANKIVTGDLRMADVHNRQFLLWFQKTNSNHKMILSLAGYDTSLTNRITFSASTNAALPFTNAMMTLAETNTLGSSENAIRVRIVQKRHRLLPDSYTTNPPPRWNAFLGFSQIQPFEPTDPISQERIVTKGDLLGICLNFGSVSPRMLDVHAQRYWKTQRLIEDDPSLTNKLTPEVYQGTLTYLMGMAYFERVGRFKQMNERLHKMSSVSWHAASLSKLLPKRNDSGALPSGKIIYQIPAIDVFFQELAFVGNGTTRPDLGDSPSQVADDFLALFMADAAAQEHDIINTFYRQRDAISTVRLLQQAQQATAKGAPPVLELNVNNYWLFATNKYGKNKIQLKDFDPDMWAQVTAAFNKPGISNFAQALVTPGPITNYGGARVAAFLMAGNSFAAIVSTNLNDGEGESLGDSGISEGGALDALLSYEFSSSYSTWNYSWDSLDYGYNRFNYGYNSSYNSFGSSIDQSPSLYYDYSLLFTAPTTSNPFEYPSESSVWQFDHLSSQLDSNTRLLSSYQTESLYSYRSDMGWNSLNDSSSLLRLVENFGDLGKTSWYGDYWNRVSDPVNVMNGDFYIDTVDLALNNGTKLELRRNYSSQNRADNQLGYGWKFAYFPYLSVATNRTIIYAAELSGSVIAYRNQSNGTWIPTVADNPTLENINQGKAGSASNPFKGRIVESVAGSVTNYTLFGADGSRRRFEVKSYPVGTLDRSRPYLQSLQDAHGNGYDFFWGSDDQQLDYGELRLIVASDGERLGLKYDAYGHVVEAFTGDGRRVQYDYDDQGDLTLVRLPDGAQVSYQYQHVETTNSVLNTSCFDQFEPPEWGADEYVYGHSDSDQYVSYSGPDQFVSADYASGTYVSAQFYQDQYVAPYTTVDGVRIDGYWIPGGHRNGYYTGNRYRPSYTMRSPGYFVPGWQTDGYYVPGIDRDGYWIHGCYDIVGRVTPFISTHLIVAEVKAGGRTLLNEYDGKRRVTNQWATVGADLRPVRNATFIYSNNFVYTNSASNTVSGFTLIVDVFGNTNRYDYTSNLITKITDSLGRAVLQDWYWPGDTNSGAYPRSLKTRIDQRGLTNRWWYDTNGNVLTNIVSGSDLTGDGATSATNVFTYTTNLLLSTTVDPSGKKIRNDYGSGSDPYLVTATVAIAADGTVISSNFMAYTNVVAVITNGFAVQTNRIFGLRNLEVNAAGTVDAATNLFAYDERGLLKGQSQLSGSEDPGVTNAFFYNTRGELVERIDAAGRMWRFEYDNLSRVTAKEIFGSATGRPMWWEYTYYNENGEIVWVDGPRYDPEDYVWRDYDGAGRQTQEIHWRSRARADGRGVEAETGDDLFATIFQEYDSFGNKTAVRDQYGNVTRMLYDRAGQMLERRRYAPDTVNFTVAELFSYGPGGDVVASVDAAGGTTTNQYTSSGKIKLRINADGSTNRWTYYLDGRTRREYLPNNEYWETTYDDAQRVVTRIFSGLPSATETVYLDRRGNSITNIDAEGFTYWRTFDALNRVKRSSGPAADGVSGSFPASARQVTTNIYDSSGLSVIARNAAGESRTTTMDPLGRPVKIETRDVTGTIARLEQFGYSPNHNAVTNLLGSSNQVAAVSFTDTLGKEVLIQHLTSPSSIEFSRNIYDVLGNLTASIDEAGRMTTFAYDELNRLKAKSLSDGATTAFNYNGVGSVTNRAMPGGLGWSGSYDAANRLIAERLDGAGMSSRQITYAYFTNGPAIGLLQRVQDGRGVTMSNVYDANRRLSMAVASGPQTEHTLTNLYTYDRRNLLTSVRETFASTSFGPSTLISNSYDAYKQLTNQLVITNGIAAQAFTASFDAAGRRSRLVLPGLSDRSFVYQADGMMTGASAGVFSNSYFYGDNGMLIRRENSGRVMNVAGRDGRGRVTRLTTIAGGTTVQDETMSWQAGTKLSAYTATRSGAGAWNDQKQFTYNQRGQLSSEQMAATSSGAIQLDYGFATNKIGVRTSMAASGAGSSLWQVPTGKLSALARVDEEWLNITNVQFRASGVAPFAASVQISIDGASPAIASYDVLSGRWGADVSASPGTHTLKATASQALPWRAAPSDTNTFIVRGSTRITNSYDAVGNIVRRDFDDGRVQTLTWDGKGRLIKLVERNASSDGFDWAATYDGIGRRLQTSWVPVTGGTSVVASNVVVVSWFDPMCDFLEIASSDNGQFVSKIYGPDLNGVYGGLQGVGGLEGTQEAGASIPVLSDAYGNVAGLILNGQANWKAARVSSYGSLPGYSPAVFSPGVLMAEAVLWRTRRIDPTGLYWLGARYYDPSAGRFISPDPLGHSTSEDLYSFAGGDPANMFDPLGKYEVDVHQWLTTFLARAAGFSDTESRQIGFQTQALDTDNRDAMYHMISPSNMRDYHFVTPERLDTLETRAYNSVDTPGAFRAMGEYLHALEDTYSHSTGVGDRNWTYYGQREKTFEVPFTEWKFSVPTEVNIGHGASGHTPDWTWSDPTKTMVMAEKVYDTLRDYADFTGATGPVRSWAEIEGAVRDFATFRPDTTNVKWLGFRNVETVTFGGYNEKIKTLDPSYDIPRTPAYLKTYPDIVTGNGDRIGSIYDSWNSSILNSGILGKKW